MASKDSYDRGKITEFNQSRFRDLVRFNLQGEIISLSSSFLSLHSKWFRDFFKVNNTRHAPKYNACQYDPETFKEVITLLYPCKHPPVGDADWNSKVEKRLELAIKLNIPKIVKKLLNNFNPTFIPQVNSIKAIDIVSGSPRYRHLLTPYLAQFKDANEVSKCVRRHNMELADRTKVIIFDHFTSDDESPLKRPRLDNTPNEAVFFDVDPAWPDARVIVIEGVSILVSTSTLALHSIVFREWFVDDPTRTGQRREAHYYDVGIGLREMTRFLSIIATDSVQVVDESLLDAVYHLQAKYAQVICEEWIWKNHIDAGKDAVTFLKMIIKVRAKYRQLDDTYILSLAPIIFNHVEQGEGLTAHTRNPPVSSIQATPLRTMQLIPSHMLTPDRTPRSPAKGSHSTPAATRSLLVNQNTATDGDTRAFVMSFFDSLDTENGARVDRLFSQWEAARLRVVVRDDTGRDHVVYLKHNEARLQDLRVELERICHIPAILQNILFGTKRLVMDMRLVEYGIKNGDRISVSRRDIGNATQTIDSQSIVCVDFHN